MDDDFVTNDPEGSEVEARQALAKAGDALLPPANASVAQAHATIAVAHALLSVRGEISNLGKLLDLIGESLHEGVNEIRNKGGK